MCVCVHVFTHILGFFENGILSEPFNSNLGFKLLPQHFDNELYKKRVLVSVT